MPKITTRALRLGSAIHGSRPAVLPLAPGTCSVGPRTAGTSPSDIRHAGRRFCGQFRAHCSLAGESRGGRSGCAGVSLRFRSGAKKHADELYAPRGSCSVVREAGSDKKGAPPVRFGSASGSRYSGLKFKILVRGGGLETESSTMDPSTSPVKVRETIQLCRGAAQTGPQTGRGGRSSKTAADGCFSRTGFAPRPT